MTSDKQLTMQALMDHDRVQPKFKAAKGSDTQHSSSRDKKEDGEDIPRRARLTSTSDSQKSINTPRPSGMNFFKLVAATRAWQRLAKKKAAEKASKPPTQYENSYQLEPADGHKFIPSKVEDVIREILETRLRDFKYRAMFVKNLTADLSNVINQKVKSLGLPRYKYVCNVVVMENKDQGVQVASRCVWNPSTDNYASYTYRNATTIATAYVYGVYFE